MTTPPSEPTDPSPARPGLFGLTRAQWHLLGIGALFLVPPLVFVVVILVINVSRLSR